MQTTKFRVQSVFTCLKGSKFQICQRKPLGQLLYHADASTDWCIVEGEYNLSSGDRSQGRQPAIQKCLQNTSFG